MPLVLTPKNRENQRERPETRGRFLNHSPGNEDHTANLKRTVEEQSPRQRAERRRIPMSPASLTSNEILSWQEE